MKSKDKLNAMTDQFVDNIALDLIDVQNGKIDIIKFINEIHKNLDSWENKIVEIANKLKDIKNG